MEVKWGGTSPSPILNDVSIRQQEQIDGVEFIIREFPTVFPYSIFFLLLVFVCKFLQSYFCVLRPLQIVLLTSNCGAGRREITKFGEGRV